MHRPYALLLGTLILCMTATATAAPRPSAVRMNVRLAPPVIFTGSMPALGGTITGDVRRVRIDWGNGKITTYVPDEPTRRMPLADAVIQDVLYDEPGTYTIRVSAYAKRGKPVVKRLNLTVADYTPELEAEWCERYGCEAPDPNPELS